MATLIRRSVSTPLGPIVNAYGVTQYNEFQGSVASGRGGNTDVLYSATANPDYLAQLNSFSVVGAGYSRVNLDRSGNTTQSGFYNYASPAKPTSFDSNGNNNSSYDRVNALYNKTTSAASKVADINDTFAIGIGGAGKNNQGPFSATRIDLGGNVELLSRNDPRYTASAYADLTPEIYARYSNKSITGKQLFSQALSYLAANDRDVLNRPFSGVSSAPTASVRFSASGGGTLSFKFGSVSF